MRCILRLTPIISLLILGWLRSTDGFGISSFGKANTDPPAPATTTVKMMARPCNRESDCAGISSTSCVRTHYDPTTKCLCGDNQPPINGQCDAPTKTLYHICSNTDECNVGLICGPPNITSSPPPHLRVISSGSKICLCDTDSGYQEHEHSCSDADILKTSLFAIVFVSCIRKLISY